MGCGLICASLPSVELKCMYSIVMTLSAALKDLIFISLGVMESVGKKVNQKNMYSAAYVWFKVI